jgi:hypothetical protein
VKQVVTVTFRSFRDQNGDKGQKREILATGKTKVQTTKLTNSAAAVRSLFFSWWNAVTRQGSGWEERMIGENRPAVQKQRSFVGRPAQQALRVCLHISLWSSECSERRLCTTQVELLTMLPASARISGLRRLWLIQNIVNFQEPGCFSSFMPLLAVYHKDCVGPTHMGPA